MPKNNYAIGVDYNSKRTEEVQKTMSELTKRGLTFNARSYEANEDCNAIRVFIVNNNVSSGYSPITELDRFTSALDDLISI